MSIQILSNTGAKQFYGNRASIFEELSKYLIDKEKLTDDDLKSFKNFTKEKIDFSISGYSSSRNNPRSTRLKTIKYENRNLVIDTSNALGNQIFNWFNLFKLIESSDFLEIKESKEPI